MLETIRQFAEDQLVADGFAEAARDAHARFFAGLEADVVTLWNSPRQREAYDWFTSDLTNLRTAFRWAADRGDLDTAATIVECAFIGPLIEQYEPAAWAEELIEPAKAVDHRKLVALYIVASQCCWIGRTEDAISYSECGVQLIGDDRYDRFPLRCEATLGAPYISPGLPEQWQTVARTMLEQIEDSLGHTRASLIMALALGGAHDEAMALTDGLVEFAESTQNPFSLAQILVAVALAYRYADPHIALESLRRAQEVAHASGNRFIESHIAVTLAPLEAQHGAPDAALDYLGLAIRNYLDSGNIATLRSPLANLASLLCELGHYGPAATIAAFADDPLSRMAFSEITATIAHLREVLGDDRYETLARPGSAMTNAAMANYALEQIDLARAQLSDPTART